MPLFGRPLESITEQDLRRLIDDEVVEGKSIDYKLELHLERGDDKKEFLADVTSFANTVGGHLLIGVRPDGDRAKELLGIKMTPEEQDRTKQQIENLLRDSIDPRLPPVQQRFIPLASGKHVLVLRIGQSWAGPHMVKTSSKFFARNSAGKFNLDTQQLRAAFAATDEIGRRMGAWRTERIGKILADEAPWTLTAGPRLIVHLMPQASFVQPGTWVTLLSGHMGDSPLLARGPVDQEPLGSGDAESEERSDEDGAAPEPSGAPGVATARPVAARRRIVMPRRVRAHG
jgi:hypothetical protein